MFYKRKDLLTVSPEKTWFPSWPFFSSLLLHGVMGYFLITWPFVHPSGPALRMLTVQIVEEKKEKILDPTIPSHPKQKKIQKPVTPKAEPRPVTPQKEAPLLTPPILQATEEEVPQALEVPQEKIGQEEKPKEKWMEKTEPGRWETSEESQDAGLTSPGKEEPAMSLTADSGSAQRGIPKGLHAGNPLGKDTEGEAGLPDDAGLTSPGKEGPAMSLTVESGSAPKGIPGGLVAPNLWGKGALAEAGFPGGGEGGKAMVPPKGSKTGSVYFHGEGKGKGDLGSYLGHARMKIEKAKRYPREARRRGWEGKVVLSFQINRKGEVDNIRLVHSSGFHELDEEGMAIVRRASPFSPPPLTDDENLEVEIPLVFRLEERR